MVGNGVDYLSGVLWTVKIGDLIIMLLVISKNNFIELYIKL